MTDQVVPSIPRAKTSSREAAKLEQAYQRLKKEIISGVYSPNERLVEAQVTEKLGISRNTLRTVMARLEHEGLVVLEPNRGGRVRSFTLEEAHDILRVREALEGLVASLAATRATAEQRERLHADLAETEDALKADDIVRYTLSNRQFHGDVIEAAGSPMASSLLESLNFPLVKFQFQAVLVPGRKSESLAEHHELLAAIDKGDAERAEQVARKHIQQVRATLERAEAIAAQTPR